MTDVMPGLGTGADVLFSLLHAGHIRVAEGQRPIAVDADDLKRGAGEIAQRTQSFAVVAKIDLEEGSGVVSGEMFLHFSRVLLEPGRGIGAA